MAPFSLVFLLPASLFFSQVASRAVNISTTWTLPQECFPQFFRYFKDPTTWDDAKVICESYNAELLTVENDERRDAARAYLKELDVLENVWCGLQRSSIEAPFVWTGGGVNCLVDDEFWQGPHPLEPEKLCMSINPLHDFRWETFPCSGPQLSPFVCQLDVPEWGNNCLVNSLPSLTITYLPEPGAIELLSDCGLDGTKRIACKGGEKQEDLIARLSCDRDEDGSTHSSTSSYTTKNHHGLSDSSTTRSSNTRHKRESGATSTSTDTSVFATEPEVKIERMPAPEPMSPLDVITIVAEYAKEDQIEETTVSVIDQTKDKLPPIQSTGHNNAHELGPLTIDTTPRLTVKNWLAEINDELSSSSTESPTTKVQSTVNPISTNAETMRTKIEIPPTTVTPEPSTIIQPTQKESHMPHPPFIQFREKPTPKQTTTEKTTTTTEEIQENGLVFTEDGLDTNATENNILNTEDQPENMKLIQKATENPQTEATPQTSPTGFEEPTEIIPAQTSDAVPETARPATINVTNDVTQAEPKNTVTETATKINTEESESTTGRREPTGKPSDSLMSEESSEEAENPKRSSRGRLFPHSNPLSFYPYFLTKVLG